MNATAQMRSIEGRVGAFKITGSVFVGDLEVDEIVQLSKQLGVPTEQLHIDGRTLKRDPSMLPSQACARTREAVAERGSMACDFCGCSMLKHRLVREPIKVGGQS
mgnify:CR=1 FL=1